MKRTILYLFLLFSAFSPVAAQNSIVGDGFGGRSWYQPTNYSAGSYSGYTVCGPQRQLFAWGDNEYKQLGVGDSLGRIKPSEVLGLDSVWYYSAGYLSGAIRSDHSAWIWGRDYGSAPIKVLDSVKFLDAGIQNIAFVKMDGTVWSMGNNFFGHFGSGDTAHGYSAAPVKMKGISNAVRVSVGAWTTTVLLEDGSVMTCGTNYGGQLGMKSLDESLLPIKVNGLEGIVDVKSNTYMNYALHSDGYVYAWGARIFYQGDTAPIILENLISIVGISACADGHFMLALNESGTTYAYGDNSYYAIGNVNGDRYIDPPRPIAYGMKDILAGETFMYLIDKEGNLWASGQSTNPHGDIGHWSGSIYLNLKDTLRLNFIELSPELDSIGLCEPYEEGDKFVEDSICFGDSLVFNGLTLKEPGTYIVDSSLLHAVLDLKVLERKQQNKKAILCAADSVLIHGKWRKAPAQFSDTLKASNSCDSIVSFNLLVSDHDSCNEKAVYIPNAFSPNFDQHNNQFRVVGTQIEKVNMKIFSRWGEKLYEVEEHNAAWDGTYLGKMCQDGVYLYLVTVYFYDGMSETFKGTVTLLK